MSTSRGTSEYGATDFNTADRVLIVLLQGNITIQRRFMRAPATAAPPLGVSVIDHTTRQILIDGKPFQGIGWYLGIVPNGNTNWTKMLDLIQTQVCYFVYLLWTTG